MPSRFRQEAGVKERMSEEASEGERGKNVSDLKDQEGEGQGKGGESDGPSPSKLITPESGS